MMHSKTHKPKKLNLDLIMISLNLNLKYLQISNCMRAWRMPSAISSTQQKVIISTSKNAFHIITSKLRKSQKHWSIKRSMVVCTMSFLEGSSFYAQKYWTILNINNTINSHCREDEHNRTPQRTPE